MDKCAQCGGRLGQAKGAPLLACLACGRIYRSDSGPALTHTGVRYEEIEEYARLLLGHDLVKR